jgi:hypothetical protein
VIEHAFLIAMIVLNLGASIINSFAAIRQLRRAKKYRADFERLLAFAAFLSCEESGAPPKVREYARAALPPGAQVIIDPPGGRVH